MRKLILLHIFLFSTLLNYSQVPELNTKIIKFVDSKMGKKVDRGECWDLANQAMIYANAKLSSTYVFGKRLNPKIDTLYPGDIIQFEKVKMKHEVGNTTYFNTMMHHTAIIYKVIDNNKIIIAEQNGVAGKKVGTLELDLSHAVSGKMYFYRPIPN